MKLRIQQAFLLMMFVLGAAQSGHAGHIVGGEMYYDCLGGNNYRFTLKMYRDCFASGPNVAQSFDNPAFITVYRGNTLRDTLRVQLSQENNIPPVLNEPCVDPPVGICVHEGVYIFTLNLPFTPEGYTVVHQRCCRNATITNVLNPNDLGGSYFVNITPQALQTCNSSPRFRYFPPIVICNTIPLDFDHSAIDANGNTLVYSLCPPLEGGGNDITFPGAQSFIGVTPFPASPPPYTAITFAPPFNANNPMGGNPAITIDPTTGRISGRPNVLGQFVVAVCVNEFDAGGNLLSTIRRDFQFNVTNCQINVFADIAETSIVNLEQLLLRQCGDTTTVTFVNQSGQAQNITGYLWEFNFGNGNIVSSTDVNPTVTFPGYGTYDVLLIANPDSAGCRDSASIIVQLFPELRAEFTYTQDLCNSDTIPFTDLSVSAGGAPITEWDWAFGDGTVSFQQDPAHFYTQAGDYNIALQVTDDNGCVDDTTMTLEYYPTPTVDVTLPDFNPCEPAVLYFDNNSLPVNGYNISWDLGDGNVSTELSPTHTYMAGTYNVQLTMTSPTGCVADTVFPSSLVVRPSPVADFSYSPNAPSIFNPTVQFQDLSSGATEWHWDFGNGDTSNLTNPIYTFPDTGVYTVMLVVTNPSDCPDTAIYYIDVAPIYTYFLPNAITPDGDNVNDLFKGQGYFYAINHFEMSIWNRWGEAVFETRDPNEAWNGRKNNNGETCQPGVYAVLVNIDGPRGQFQQIKGFVTLVR